MTKCNHDKRFSGVMFLPAKCGGCLGCFAEHLAKELAKAEKEAEELAMYKTLFSEALEHVDAVFQFSGNDCSLPDFCTAGEDKFRAVRRLAIEYKKLSEATQ